MGAREGGGSGEVSCMMKYINFKVVAAGLDRASACFQVAFLLVSTKCFLYGDALLIMHYAT